MINRPITHKMPENVRAVLCLGDSITAGYFDESGLGWVGRFSQLLAEYKHLGYGVQNCGVSGDTVFDAWHNLLSHGRHINPERLIIKIGVNDTCVREGIAPETTQISLADTVNTWNKILDFVKNNNIQTLIVGPLPVEKDIIRFDAWDEDRKTGQTSFRYEQGIIKNYNDHLERLCADANIPFLRLFETWHSRDDLANLFIDGLHPNGKGHELLAAQIFKRFKELGF